jgi:capsular exopolysaccharide synthesis family protein
MAATLANTLVSAYIDHSLGTRLDATKNAVKWLADQIESERKKVEDAELALLKYKQEMEIITDFSSDTEKITAEKLASLNQEVVSSQSRRVEAETRYQQALTLENNPDMLDAIPEVLSNDIVKEIKKMEVNLYNRMSELSKKYGRNHPQMKAIENELADLKKRKGTEAQRVVSSLRNEYRLAVAREESLKKALEEQKAQSLEMNKKAINFGVLQRQVESTRQMYELLIQRFKETSLSEEMKTANIRVIDRAEVPGAPFKPNKQRDLLLAMVLGLFLAVGAAFLLEYLDNTIKLPDEMKTLLNIPYLGPVPSFTDIKPDGNEPKDLVTLYSPKSMASESFRGIRTGIIYSSADTPPQVILVTSATPEEGKTLNAANLGVTMANSGSRVLLMDCDMRRPRLHKIFDAPVGSGVSGILVGAGELQDAIFHTPIENLDVLPAGPIPPNPSEILGSRKMGDLITRLRGEYDRILIDSPPLSAVTDATVLAPQADGVVLIIRANETPRQMVQNALAKLRFVNAHILGGILNGIDTGRSRYHYYYYHYQHYYGEGGPEKKKSRHKKS